MVTYRGIFTLPSGHPSEVSAEVPEEVIVIDTTDEVVEEVVVDVKLPDEEHTSPPLKSKPATKE